MKHDMNSFEDYLHGVVFPKIAMREGLLDDDWTDREADWLAECPQEFVDHANKYASLKVIEALERVEGKILGGGGKSGCNVNLGAILMILASLCICTTARGAEIPPDRMIACVLGESEAEPYKVKVWTAEAIKNRGSERGVYGCQAVKLVNGQYKRGLRVINPSVVEVAKKAVMESQSKGYKPIRATVFGCGQDLKHFYRAKWFKAGKYSLVAHDGNTFFFKGGVK